MSFNTLEEQAAFIEDARREWRQEEEVIEETGFQVGTVRWDPMLQPNETAGYLVVKADHDEYSVAWEYVNTVEKFIAWFQFPAKRCFWGSGPHLDDFLQVWFRVWEWKRNRKEAQ